MRPGAPHQAAEILKIFSGKVFFVFGPGKRQDHFQRHFEFPGDYLRKKRIRAIGKRRNADKGRRPMLVKQVLDRGFDLGRPGPVLPFVSPVYRRRLSVRVAVLSFFLLL